MFSDAMTGPGQTTALLGIGALGCGLAIAAVACWRRRRAELALAVQCTTGKDAGVGDGDVDIPDEYEDPILLGVMEDPVILCATGQIYSYSSLRRWFTLGNRICPRTNTVVNDAQVTRLPWLRQRIREWRVRVGLGPAAEDDSLPAEELRALHPNLPSWINDIRTDSGHKRRQAANDLYGLLRSWDVSDPGGSATPMKNQRVVRGHVMDDMVWLLRYGEPYLQGVAASVLAFCEDPEEVQWLAATAVIPAVLACQSTAPYTAQAATRLLYNLTRAGSTARTAIIAAGGAQSLLRLVSTDRDECKYSRDRAAASLAVLSKDLEAKSYLRKHALVPLKALFLGSEDRWEKRDSATALLKLFNSEELLSTALNPKELFDTWWCSRAWLEGRISSPSDGYTDEEVASRRDLAFWLANAGEFMDQLLAPDLEFVLPDAEAVQGGDDVGEEGDDAGPIP